MCVCVCLCVFTPVLLSIVDTHLCPRVCDIQTAALVSVKHACVRTVAIQHSINLVSGHPGQVIVEVHPTGLDKCSIPLHFPGLHIFL